MTLPKPKSSWLRIKNCIRGHSQEDLINLISELYSLTQINKDFLSSKFLQNNQILIIDRYKKAITKHIAPNEPWKENQAINIKAGKNTLNEYEKIFNNDHIGLIDLMLHYVECGSNFSIEFGVYESYHISLEAIFAKALKLMKQYPDCERQDFLNRTFLILELTKNKMWKGHFERMQEIFDEYYPHNSFSCDR